VTRPDGDDDADGHEPSPLQHSLASAFGFISAMLVVLVVVLLFAAVMILTRDPQPGQAGRAGIMVGLAVTCGGIAVLLRRARRRPTNVSVHAGEVAAEPPGLDDADGWHRRGLGPRWFDGVALIAPLVLVALPLALLRSAPIDAEALGGIALITGILELLIAPLVVLGRRELVSVWPTAIGLRFVRRSGRELELRRGEVVAIALQVRYVRGMAYGTIEVLRRDGPPLTMREPMTAPLPTIAQRCAAHVGVAVTQR